MKQRGKSGSGCGLMVAICLLSCCLFILNGSLVAGAYGIIGGALPPLLRHEKITQLVVFIAPIVLLLVEWRLLEMLFGRVFRRSQG